MFKQSAGPTNRLAARRIDQFAGALSKKKATKGILITTSTFTKDALASVREHSSRIILIDGSTLVDYMIDHGVGVSVAFYL